ncbi:MAG TPA: serine hydrolase domain-containing protein [Phycisphaerae bacterium]|nr:serine hydrolase domain-containing protein [Phycisphaerae bacterium]HOJ72976.1 serine hydrolase domain-containing protein [Phycisphaerae bacterium]HOM50160.1 serine hydrolase domain-containing protein [Phycisphaerae bacterium]HON65280.1 serine hydrolase domain-containing protein [Phycisphaerae bacterium]HOQ84321.1 serine hydrolase domain-containing protein [Phycisphaerae bacterium]
MGSPQWSQQEVLDLIGSRPPDFDPGMSYSYSNGGYYLLGVIVERATKRAFQDLLEEYFLNRKGLVNTEIIAGSTSGSPTHFYSIPEPDSELTDVTRWDWSWDWTSGAGVTTVGDMLQFLDLLFVEGLLSPGSMQEMTTVTSPANRYGFGMNIKTYQDKVLYTHWGAGAGTLCAWVYLPDIQSGLFVAVNRLDMADPLTPAYAFQEVIDRACDLLISRAQQIAEAD